MVTSSRTKTSICNLALDILQEGPLSDVDTQTTAVAKWFQRNYEEMRDAELAEHNWKFAIKRRRLYPRDFVLRGKSGSTYGTLTGAWGLLRLIEDWSGDLVKLRRSSDDTTDDFSFDTDDGLILDTDGIGTFLGTGNGFVDTLYDQSANARPLVQATTAKQPAYDEEEEESGRPSAAFDGSNDLLATSGNMSTLVTTTAGWIVVAGLIDAATLDSATATSDHLILGDNGQKLGLYVRKGGTLYAYNDDGSADTITDSIPLLVPFVATLRHDSGTLYVSVNGRDEVSTTSGTTSSLASVFQIGDIGGSNALDFQFFAAATFSTAPASEERKRIVERLMRYVKAGGADEIGWSYRYPKPGDCLRVISVRTDGEWEYPPIPHEVEGDDILTDQESYIDIRYMRQFTDTAGMPHLFVQALAGRMAERMAHWLTGKATMVQIASVFAERARSEARRSNAIEGTPERPYADDVIAIRYAQS